jgi:hypothetical protein
MTSLLLDFALANQLLQTSAYPYEIRSKSWYGVVWHKLWPCYKARCWPFHRIPMTDLDMNIGLVLLTDTKLQSADRVRSVIE